MKSENIDAAALLQNNTPQDDFCGMSPNEMHRLVYNPFGMQSPLHLQPTIAEATLDAIPFFRLSEEFLRIIQRDKSIKLTGLGYLPRRTLVELYEHRFIIDPIIEAGIARLRLEHNSVALSSLHMSIESTTLTKKSKGRLLLTKQGERMLLPENRQELFRNIFQTFTLSFAWSNNDRYTRFPVGQYGWGFTMYLLHKFGNGAQTIQFYADKYRKAFPDILKYFPSPGYTTPLKAFTSCYSVRTFDRFLDWFGFVTIEPSSSDIFSKSHESKVTMTDVLGKVIRFD